ncbi:hypothetical protein IWW47_002540, partial [Coemansia sp. RSA 2052]
LAAVFHASRADVAAIMREAAPLALADRPLPAARRLGNSELVASAAASPEMDRGSLTPRGRWELKTGRRKFTAMSLVAPSSPTPHSRAATKHGGDDADDNSAQLLLLLPRGPRAVYTARSYESQWLLNHALRFNIVANPYYQRALEFADKHHILVPPFCRTANIDFRWVASYPNLRFLALVFCLLLLVRYLFF